MNPELFERLLYREESDSLDFKVKQYPPLETKQDEAKEELLKDILAFGNSFRATDGHILIGVRDVQGGRAEVVGVDRHFDDADLQQFANKKTNGPVNFSYEAFAYEGKQTGILTFKTQTRPVFLNNDFGKLRRLMVYIRRSSSTDEARHEEIAAMSKDPQQTTPVLELQFGNPNLRQKLGQSIILRPPLPHLHPELNPPMTPSESL